MFTVKAYENSYKYRVWTALSLTVYIDKNGEKEFTCHLPSGMGSDFRIDLKYPSSQETADDPARYQMIVVENMEGKTTEVHRLPPGQGS